MKTINGMMFKKFNPKDEKHLEKIFHFNINPKYISNIETDSFNEKMGLTYFIEDSIFGYTEEIQIKEFFKRLTENNLYLDINK